MYSVYCILYSENCIVYSVYHRDNMLVNNKLLHSIYIVYCVLFNKMMYKQQSL